MPIPNKFASDVSMFLDLRRRGFTNVEILSEKPEWSMRWMQRTFKAFEESKKSPKKAPAKIGRPRLTTPTIDRRFVRYVPVLEGYGWMRMVAWGAWGALQLLFFPLVMPQAT